MKGGVCTWRRDEIVDALGVIKEVAYGGMEAHTDRGGYCKLD
jgi:hypothetical protein